MPSLPFELTDENNVVRWRFDEGGALQQLDENGTVRAEIYEGIAFFDASGTRVVDVVENGGVTVWRPSGVAAVQCWFDGTDGRATAYNDDGSVRADL